MVTNYQDGMVNLFITEQNIEKLLNHIANLTGCLCHSSLVELVVIHSPHRPLHVLHSAEALVQRQVVADSVLKRISPIIDC